MATPNIVPRADSEGGLGTASKYWGSAYIDLIYVGAGKMGRDADNLLDFSTDNKIKFRVGATNELNLDNNALYPESNDGVGLGYNTNAWSNLFLADGAVINFNNGNVTLTHSNNALTLADSDAIQVGTGGDLAMLHDGSNSHLKNWNGDLYISQNADDGDIIFQCDDHEGGIETYFFLDGSRNTTGDQSPYTVFPDGATLALGSDADLRLKHTGSNGELTNKTGTLYINQDVNDGDIIFRCDDGSGGVAAYLTLDGSATRIDISKYMRFADGVEARFGAQSDLQIHHDGSNSYITQNGTGDLYIKQMTADEDLVFQCDDGAGGDATYFYLDGSSATHDGSATTALYTNWPDKSRITVGTSHDLQIYHDGSTTMFQNQTGDLKFRNFADDKDIIFETDDGSGSYTTYFKLDGSEGHMIASKELNFADGIPATFGDKAGGDLEIKEQSGNSYISNFTGHLYIMNNADNSSIIFQNDDASGGLTTYFYLDGALSTPHTRFPDSSILALGTDADLAINHNGTNSLIENYTGDLYITNNADDGDIIFKSDDGSGGTTEYFRLDGDNTEIRVSQKLQLSDSVKLALGNGEDLNIFHDSSNSYFENKLGNLIFRQEADDADIIFKCDDGSGGDTAYLTLDGGNTDIDFHKNAHFLDNVNIKVGSATGGDLQIYHNASHSLISNQTGDLFIRNQTDDGDIKFQCDDGSGSDMDYVLLDGSEVSTAIKTIKVLMPNLPTSDPSVAGQLYIDASADRVLKVSAG